MTPEPRSDIPPSSPSAPVQDSDDGEGSFQSNKSRQAVTGHNVGYVLYFGTAGVIAGFLLVYLIVAG